MLPRLAAFAPSSRLQRLKVLESARPIVCSLHAPFAKSAFRNVITCSELIGSSKACRERSFEKCPVPWKGEASVTRDLLKTMRGLAFEKVYLVEEKIRALNEELHAAVVLVSGNDCLFGEQGHNCVRIDFDPSGVVVSTMRQDEFVKIEGTTTELRMEHGCLGKDIATVLDEWSDSRYHVKYRNCIHFAGALLKGIGIESERVEKLQSRAQEILRRELEKYPWLAVLLELEWEAPQKQKPELHPLLAKLVHPLLAAKLETA